MLIKILPDVKYAEQMGAVLENVAWARTCLDSRFNRPSTISEQCVGRNTEDVHEATKRPLDLLLVLVQEQCKCKDYLET